MTTFGEPYKPILAKNNQGPFIHFMGAWCKQQGMDEVNNLRIPRNKMAKAIFVDNENQVVMATQ